METEKELIHLPVEELLRALNVDKNVGLSHNAISGKLKSEGYNEIKVHTKRNILIEFLKNFLNPLILILLVIVVISFILGDTLNGILVTLMVILSVGLNFYQEHKATKAADKLQEKV